MNMVVKDYVITDSFLEYETNKLERSIQYYGVSSFVLALKYE